MNDTIIPRRPFLNGWRIAGWGSLLAILLLPALAMQLDVSGVDWTASDFVFAAILLGFLGSVVEFAVRFARGGAARAGYLLAGFTAFFTVWSNAAVGIIGEDDRINVYFFAIILAGLAASALARFRPSAMRWIALILAVAQPVLGIAALFVIRVYTGEWVVLTILALLWSVSAWSFHRAAVK